MSVATSSPPLVPQQQDQQAPQRGAGGCGSSPPSPSPSPSSPPSASSPPPASPRLRRTHCLPLIDDQLKVVDPRGSGIPLNSRIVSINGTEITSKEHFTPASSTSVEGFDVGYLEDHVEAELRYRKLLRKSALGDVLSEAERIDMEVLRGRFTYGPGARTSPSSPKSGVGGLLSSLKNPAASSSSSSATPPPPLQDLPPESPASPQSTSSSPKIKSGWHNIRKAASSVPGRFRGLSLKKLRQKEEEADDSPVADGGVEAGGEAPTSPATPASPSPQVWSREEDNLLRHLQTKKEKNSPEDPLTPDELEQLERLSARFEDFISDGLAQMSAAAAAENAKVSNASFGEASKQKIKARLSKIFDGSKRNERQRQQSSPPASPQQQPVLYPPPPLTQEDKEEEHAITAYF